LEDNGYLCWHVSIYGAPNHWSSPIVAFPSVGDVAAIGQLINIGARLIMRCIA
jgi:hypothetical protein